MCACLPAWMQVLEGSHIHQQLGFAYGLGWGHTMSRYTRRSASAYNKGRLLAIVQQVCFGIFKSASCLAHASTVPASSHVRCPCLYHAQHQEAARHWSHSPLIAVRKGSKSAVRVACAAVQMGIVRQACRVGHISIEGLYGVYNSVRTCAHA